MPALKPDQIVGNYRIVRRIGVGGMGAVYEGRHTVLQHRAALKVMHSEGQVDPVFFQRFLNEARAAGQIAHPGIVKVFDFGRLEEDGASWLAMEFLEGETLADRVRRHLRQTGQGLGESALWIPHETASALSAAHGEGIIHRDLKPANIMLVPDPVALEGERVRVLDFGVAKLHSDQHTRRGAVLGTPAYMALEQIIDSAVVDGKADVFSLGVILYEILAGRMPHKPGQVEVMLGKRILEPITPLQQLLPSLSAPLGELVMAMLSQEPTGRPTMAEVDRELRRARGLPPPRPSGFHQAMLAGVDPHFSGSEVSGGTESLVPQATPSGEKALGELSPPQVPVPSHSLSSMPSVVAPAPPPLRAGPYERTAAGAPTPLPVAAVASPSAPTASSTPSRRAYYLLGAALMLSAAFSLVIAKWPHQQPQRTAPSANGPSTAVLPAAPPRAALSAERVPPGADPPASPLVPAVAPALSAETSRSAVTRNPDKPAKEDKTREVVSGPASRRTNDGKATSSPSGRSGAHCAAESITAACIKGQNLSPDVQRYVVLALRERQVRLCAGDHLVISMGPEGVHVVEAPTRLSETAQQDFLLTLRGYLDVTPRAGKIQIQCSERQPRTDAKP